MMWYTNSYRRHLCDMHIADWDDRFLSQFRPEKYVQDLITANVDSPMIYLQSHTGLCNFPTKVGTMHKALVGKEDLIKQTVDLCREKGMPVVGYYSLIFNTCEHDSHPDWRMLNQNGVSQRADIYSKRETAEFTSAPPYRYGLCCPNNPDYTQFVHNQIDEILDYFTLDGLFFDMPFWEHTCYCDHCRARWTQEMGGEIPADSQNNPSYPVLVNKKCDWMAQWVQSLTDYIKSRNPEISVEYNFAAAISHDARLSCGFGVGSASDFVGGDLYGGIYNHSAACKFYKNITKNQPFDYMFSRCKPRLSVHTLTKTHDQLLTEVMATTAHHGASTIIDAMDPIGTTDSRFYKTLGEVYRFEAQYEPYLSGKMTEDVGIYYNPSDRYNLRGEQYHVMPSMKQMAKTFISSHIPFGVTGIQHTFEDYQILAVASITDLDVDAFDRLEQYVRNGGNLYISGLESEIFAKRLLDCEILGRTDEDHIYIAPKNAYESLFLDFNQEYPLPFSGTAPLIIPNADSEVLATLTLPYIHSRDVQFASIHSNPPGVATEYPMVIRRKLDKGNIIWSAVNLEAIPIYEYGKIFTNLLELFHPAYSFSSTAPGNVELTLFKRENRWLVHTYQVSEEEFVSSVPGFTVSVRTQTAPKQVVLAPTRTPVPFRFKDGITSFEARDLKIYDLYLLEWSML